MQTANHAVLSCGREKTLNAKGDKRDSPRRSVEAVLPSLAFV